MKSYDLYILEANIPSSKRGRKKIKKWDFGYKRTTEGIKSIHREIEDYELSFFQWGKFIHKNLFTRKTWITPKNINDRMKAVDATIKIFTKVIKRLQTNPMARDFTDSPKKEITIYRNEIKLLHKLKEKLEFIILLQKKWSLDYKKKQVEKEELQSKHFNAQGKRAKKDALQYKWRKNDPGRSRKIKSDLKKMHGDVDSGVPTKKPPKPWERFK